MKNAGGERIDFKLTPQLAGEIAAMLVDDILFLGAITPTTIWAALQKIEDHVVGFYHIPAIQCRMYITDKSQEPTWAVLSPVSVYDSNVIADIWPHKNQLKNGADWLPRLNLLNYPVDAVAWCLAKIATKESTSFVDPWQAFDWMPLKSDLIKFVEYHDAN